LAHYGYTGAPPPPPMLQPRPPVSAESHSQLPSAHFSVGVFCCGPHVIVLLQELKAEARGQSNPSAHGGYTSAPQQLPTNATTPASSFSAGAGRSANPGAAAGGGGFSRGAAAASAATANDGWGAAVAGGDAGGYAGGLRGRGVRAAAAPSVDEYSGSNVRGRGRPTAAEGYGEPLGEAGGLYVFMFV
jgi:hypothetical protein